MNDTSNVTPPELSGKEWIFEDNQNDILEFYESEKEACARQRIYRKTLGFDPITGVLSVSHKPSKKCKLGGNNERT